MNSRVYVIAPILAFLAACGSTSTDSPAEPTSAAQPTAVSTVAPATEDTTAQGPAAASDLVGTWRADDVDWTVRFKDDGTYVMDFQGVEDFMSGRYSLTDGVVSLQNDEGTDKGKVEGDTLVFSLGTLERA